MSIFPSDDFNPTIYRNRYFDLAELDDMQLIDHYRDYGINENRVPTCISTREEFLSLLTDQSSVLEIGVFDSPSLDFLRESSEVKVIHYSDWFDRDELIERAITIKNAGGDRDPSKVPELEWVLSRGFDQINHTYDAIVSHHCAEHQPDLIQHLLDVRSILSDGGWYLISLPNKNSCFDHFIPETTIVDLLTAYYLQRRKPSFQSVLEHHLFTSHTHSDGINPYDSRNPNMKLRFEKVLAEYNESEYIDVHCWQFTPISFQRLISQLDSLRLIPSIDELKVYPAGGEFYAAIAFA